MIAYFNGRFLPKDEVRVSPDDRGFTFADGVYEVIRSYDGSLFRAKDHATRLFRSLDQLRIAWPGRERFLDIATQLLDENDLSAAGATVYLQVTRGVAPRKHPFPDEPVHPTIYGFAAPYEHDPEKWEHGVKVVTIPDLRWARCDIKSLALLPNLLGSQHAKEQGVEEAILIRDGVVTEGSHTSFCAIFGERLVTHPLTNHILGGITRKVVLELCHQLDIPVEPFPVLQSRLVEADEMMILGTTTEVTGVVNIDGRTVGNGLPGPVTRRLHQAFRALHGN
jgi:D-alanine transaminase